MPRLSTCTTVPALLLAAACANSGANYTPVIDGPKGPKYESDLAACQQLAASGGVVDGRVAGSTAAGAGIGAASAVIWDGNSSNLGEAAAVGAIAGLASGVARQNSSRENIVRNCMAGRGYRVLG
ncbi:glycine zipper family protein [Sedimentitalea todarodis]|uniref:Glycine zipper family protein n=1 Tax=Sedimentitalea todarodis TaxID=1631240 RepID=A0ABU3VGS2_9RHOB|nr:glycine zipper family protein [Sedimentitalea todarodis]MDU9004874.1 glycine zipper family protein [Sedimentitalea todarodis]